MPYVQAQSVLTFEDFVSTALQKNPGIRVARNNTAISKNNHHPGRAGLLPSVTLNAGASYQNNSTRQTFSAAGVDPVEQNGAYVLGQNASLDLSYTLFNGLATFHTFHRLEESAELARLQTRLTIENTILQVAQSYYEVARLQQNLQNTIQQLEISRQRLERADNRFSFGSGTKLEVLNAQVDLNADSVLVANARLNLENAKRNLHVLTGELRNTAYQVDTTAQLGKDYNQEALTVTALERNTTIRQARLQHSLAEWDLKLAKAARMPVLSLDVGYRFNRSENEVGFLLESRNLGLNAGITLSMPIYDGSQRNLDIQNAEISMESRNEELRQSELQAETDLANAFARYQNQLYVLSIERNNVRTAQQNFERTREAFNLGQITTTQFRESQLNLLQSRLRRNEAVFTAKLAEIQLLQISGQLIEEIQGAGQ